MFTLAHLSDIHLAPLPPPRWTDLIGKRLTGYINWRRKRRFIHDPATLATLIADLKSQAADHIAVTGDIVNIALRDEFRHGRDFLEAVGPARDVSFVPGNHDIYVADGARLAAQEWAAYMADDDGRTGFPYIRRRGPVALIGLSSGVPTAPFLATGWLGTRQMIALTDMLKTLRDENLFRVVMIHHPPLSQASRHKRLLDADVFMRVIAMQGAELILHGHDHVHMLNWLAGPDGGRVPAIGVPSASARPGMDKDNAAYHLYRIGGAPGAWTCEVVSRGVTAEGGVVEEKRFALFDH
ncbi:MAG: metallophosphoesterase [Rhodopseudomonas sp.]|nr:metallophosphoesterase [Rhodopseudomonas sp.]